MKWLLLVLSSALVAFSNAENACYKNAGNDQACQATDTGNDLPNCNAEFSGFKDHVVELQAYANHQLEKSFEYLLLATNFGTYKRDRPGFAKQFHSLSDKAWNNGIDLIKHITKRGGEHDFKVSSKTIELNRHVTNESYPIRVVAKPPSQELDLNEIQALALTLDYEKSLAQDAHTLSYKYTHRFHDPEVAHFIEEKFFESQADTIRKLSGYTNDLKNLLSNFKETGDVSFAYYFFDEYLAKQA